MNARRLTLAVIALAVGGVARTPAGGAADDGLTITEVSRVNNVVFSPNGKRLVGVSGKDLKVWDAATGKVVRSLEVADDRATAACGPGGKFVAAGRSGKEAVVWDTDTGTVAHTLPRGAGTTVLGVAFSPDACRFATTTGSATVRVWDLTTGGLLHELRGHTFWTTCVAFSPDGKLLAVGNATSVGGANARTFTVTIWDAETGQRVRALEGHAMSIWSVAFSPDGRLLAVATGDYQNKVKGGEVKVWDVVTGREVCSLEGHPSCVWCVAFSPDGKLLASAGGTYTGNPKTTPGEVKVWDVAAGREVLTLREHKGTVFGVAFAPDGRRLASSGGDGTVRVIDVMARLGRTIAGTAGRDFFARGV
jgi:WD40 repeat protein